MACGETSIPFSTTGGIHVLINRYFLHLYNDFFRDLLEKHENLHNLVFVFDETSLEELENLQQDIHNKHLHCGVDLQTYSNDENDRVLQHEQEENIKGADLIKESSHKIICIEDGEINDKVPEESTKVCTDDSQSNEVLDTSEPVDMQCPFDCPEPAHVWTADSLYAHLQVGHRARVDNNDIMTVKRLLGKLKSEISGKCIFCNFYDKKGGREETISRLKQHYRHKHIEKPGTCYHCGKVYGNEKILKEHQSKLNAEGDICQQCGKSFKRGRGKLQQHIIVVHEERKFRCEVKNCNKLFAKRLPLERHIKVVHEKNKPWICDKCGTKMAQFDNLRMHRYKVHGYKYESVQEYRSQVEAGKHPFSSDPFIKLVKNQ